MRKANRPQRYSARARDDPPRRAVHTPGAPWIPNPTLLPVTRPAKQGFSARSTTPFAATLPYRSPGGSCLPAQGPGGLGPGCGPATEARWRAVAGAQSCTGLLPGYLHRWTGFEPPEGCGPGTWPVSATQSRHTTSQRPVVTGAFAPLTDYCSVQGRAQPGRSAPVGNLSGQGRGGGRVKARKATG